LCVLFREVLIAERWRRFIVRRENALRSRDDASQRFEHSHGES